MTVRELIAELSEMDLDAEVYARVSEDGETSDYLSIDAVDTPPEGEFVALVVEA